MEQSPLSFQLQGPTRALALAFQRLVQQVRLIHKCDEALVVLLAMASVVEKFDVVGRKTMPCRRSNPAKPLLATGRGRASRSVR
jgi:hypothetical protein